MKQAIQWLTEALCFVLSVVLADHFRLWNRQLPVPVVMAASGITTTMETNNNENKQQ